MTARTSYPTRIDLEDLVGRVMRAGGPFIAWFTDPAGNVLSVLQER